MVQVRIAHQGREYDVEMNVQGEPTANDVKMAVSEELNLSSDSFILKHGSKDLTDDCMKGVIADPQSNLVLVLDQGQGGLQEVLTMDDIATSLLVRSLSKTTPLPQHSSLVFPPQIEHLPLLDMKQTENLLLSYFGAFGSITSVFLQQDESWQQQWSVLTYAPNTDIHSIPTTRPVGFSENCTIKLLSSLELAQEGAVHVLGYLGDLFRHGRAEGQLGTAVMRTFDSSGNERGSRCFIRVIEEHSPSEALRAWVVQKEDDRFSAFDEAAERSEQSRREQQHPAFVHSRAMGGRIVSSAAKLNRAASRDRSEENVSTATQHDSDSGVQVETSLRHNAGCTCKNCQCGRECACNNCAHWSR